MWDWRQRKGYAAVLVMIVGVIVVIGVTVGVYRKDTLLNYLLIWFFPALSAIIQSVDESREHVRIASDKQGVARDVNSILDDVARGKASVDRDKCRDIQDDLFRLRNISPPVPMWWYRLSRARYESDMRAGSDELTRQLERAKS
jgi:hypothetical protein